MAAKRKNSTDFIKEGGYTRESDGIGGFREYNSTASKEKHALIELKCTRFWIYSFREKTETGDIIIQYNGITETLHTSLPDQRVESVLIYESPEFEYSSITLTLRTSNVLMLHYLYFEAPDEDTRPIQMSVGLVSMYKEKTANCYNNKENKVVELSSSLDFKNFGCDYTYLNSPNAHQCGLRCWSKEANYEYTFKGIKFALYGTYDPNHGLDLEIHIPITITFENNVFANLTKSKRSDLDLLISHHFVEIDVNNNIEELEIRNTEVVLS